MRDPFFSILHSMAAEGALPRYFALFNESYHRSQPSDADYCHNRIKILGTMMNGRHRDLPTYTLYVPSIPLSDSLSDYQVLHRTDTSSNHAAQVPLRVHILITRDAYTTYVWKTGLSVHYSAINQYIPVYDFSVHGRHPGDYLYRLVSDTYDMCRERQRAQRALRNQILGQIRSMETLPTTDTLVNYGGFITVRPPTPIPNELYIEPLVPDAPAAPEPAPTAPPALIPPFVAEALKRDAIARKESCPIATTPFEETTPVTILSCFHIFDAATVAVWLRQSKKCPVCRQEGFVAYTL